MDRIERARQSLEGLSVGDAFGERFFVSNDIVEHLIQNRAIPRGDWRLEGDEHPVWFFTDDTLMALSVYASLREFGEINQDWLAKDFADKYHPERGYGPAMHQYLARIRQGAKWQREAPNLFTGSGSFGNGAAMRVAPIGAYFFDDMHAVIENAQRSAEVTHAHPEGIAGAVAIAAAVALAWQLREAGATVRGSDFIDMVLPHVPDSVVLQGVMRAKALPPDCSVQLAVSALGNGSRVTAQDTVPFTVWNASRHIDSYEEALWSTVSGLGDRDTTCAIVGGIVAGYVGTDGIPEEWVAQREPLPDWAMGI